MTIGRLCSALAYNQTSPYGGGFGAAFGLGLVHYIMRDVPSLSMSDRAHKGFVYVNFTITGAVLGTCFKQSAPLFLASCIFHKLFFNKLQ